MRKVFIILSRILLGIGVLWGLLTLWVEQTRMGEAREYAVDNARGTVLVLFNPDPIYNLDEQVAQAFASAAKQEGWAGSVAPLAAADTIDFKDYGLFVFCVNTYNWSPDRPSRRFILGADWLAGKPVVPIILGSGSTARSGRVLRELLQAKGAQIIKTTDLWLMRPNDESQPERSNVEIARSKAARLARESLAELEKSGGMPEK